MSIWQSPLPEGAFFYELMLGGASLNQRAIAYASRAVSTPDLDRR